MVDGASSTQNESNVVDEEPDDRLVIDPNNIESSFAFQDAKRKV